MYYLVQYSFKKKVMQLEPIPLEALYYYKRTTSCSTDFQKKKLHYYLTITVLPRTIVI